MVRNQETEARLAYAAQVAARKSFDRRRADELAQRDQEREERSRLDPVASWKFIAFWLGMLVVAGALTALGAGDWS